jgi:hypothetical protein
MTGAAVVTATVVGALYFFAANFSFQSRAISAAGRSRCDHNGCHSALDAHRETVARKGRRSIDKPLVGIGNGLAEGQKRTFFIDCRVTILCAPMWRERRMSRKSRA